MKVYNVILRNKFTNCTSTILAIADRPTEILDLTDLYLDGDDEWEIDDISFIQNYGTVLVKDYNWSYDDFNIYKM